LDAVLESLFYGKPVVCISVLEEHLEVARRLEETGAGLGVRDINRRNSAYFTLKSKGVMYPSLCYFVFVLFLSRSVE